MKRALLLGIAAGLAFVAGSVFSFWLEERRVDRQWINHRHFPEHPSTAQHMAAIRFAQRTMH